MSLFHKAITMVRRLHMLGTFWGFILSGWMFFHDYPFYSQVHIDCHSYIMVSHVVISALIVIILISWRIADSMLFFLFFPWFHFVISIFSWFFVAPRNWCSYHGTISGVCLPGRLLCQLEKRPAPWVSTGHDRPGLELYLVKIDEVVTINHHKSSTIMNHEIYMTINSLSSIWLYDN